MPRRILAAALCAAATLVTAGDAPPTDYRIIGQFLKGSGFATIQTAVNGTPGAGPIDLAKETFYADPSGEIDLGVFHLAAGRNRLELSCLAGAAGGRPLQVGIDYIIPLPLR